MKAAHCSSLRERPGGGQEERTQDLQARPGPSQPSLLRQTRRLVCRPSEPQDREHRDHGDHGDQAEAGRTLTTSTGETERVERASERLRPSV